MISKGVPKRFALIYLPNENELEQIRKKPERILIKKEEEKVREKVYDGNLILNNIFYILYLEDKPDEKIDNGEIAEYLPLLDNSISYIPNQNISINKLVPLKDLFPTEEDKNQRKRRRNQRERERRKEKKLKNGETEKDGNGTKSLEKLQNSRFEKKF